MKAAAIEKENLPQKGAKPVHHDYRASVFAFNAILLRFFAATLR